MEGNLDRDRNVTSSPLRRGGLIPTAPGRGGLSPEAPAKGDTNSKSRITNRGFRPGFT